MEPFQEVVETLIGRFTFWVIREIAAKAEEEYYSSDAIRRELGHWQYLWESNEITLKEYEEHEHKLIQRLREGRERGFE